MHQSVATIKSPEFINLQPLDINPLMESCEIKVLYIGQNRNHSFISKEVANEMSKTLRGAPIVGYYRDQANDFGDHGDQVIIDGDGFRFNCLTKPYGFVAPDAKVWFQEFEDTDDFGQKVTREYLMTTGYLWTGQFEEAKRVLTKGNNQSMELDEATLDGHWSTDSKSGIEFFIINDATFSKLCLLGEDVEPCFEGARVTAPQVSTSFSKEDSDFRNTLFNMMKDLKFVLERRTGMQQKEDTNFTETKVDVAVEDTEFKEKDEKTQDNSNKESSDEQNNKESSDEQNKESDTSEDKTEEPSDEDSEEKDKKKYELELTQLQQSYNELFAQYKQLTLEYEAAKKELSQLNNFKLTIEREKKDALIDTFYMLSDEDKIDVINNKDKYSLDEIEAKLSVICFRKKVNFDLESSDQNEEKIEDITTYSLQGSQTTIPAWIKSIQKAHNDNNTI